jgi:hypothetical protein
MSITLAQICNAVETTLATATGLTYTQSYNELEEGMNDTPTLQVYWNGLNQDPGGTADRSTFRAGRRQTEIEIYCDLYATTRNEIGENMAALLPLIDAIQDVMEAQDAKPYFGLNGLQAFRWSAQRVTFQYTDPLRLYVGARFILTFRVF